MKSTLLRLYVNKMDLSWVSEKFTDWGVEAFLMKPHSSTLKLWSLLLSLLVGAGSSPCSQQGDLVPTGKKLL